MTIHPIYPVYPGGTVPTDADELLALLSRGPLFAVRLAGRSQWRHRDCRRAIPDRLVARAIGAGHAACPPGTGRVEITDAGRARRAKTLAFAREAVRITRAVAAEMKRAEAGR